MYKKIQIARRTFLAALGVTACCARGACAATAPDIKAEIASLEAKVGGRIGVAGLDASNGRRVSYRGDERFAMCSTFKWLLAAAVLARVDAGKMTLADKITFTRADLLATSPVTEAYLREGAMTVDALCGAIVKLSDNTAANLLLTRVGGPAGLTQFLRKAGDVTTRLDRTELELNSNLPGDMRDTTTPHAMVASMNSILLDNVLKPDSRDMLADWLRASRTGAKRLRAGLPPKWAAGDKTGTGGNGAVNDVAIVWPPDRVPLLIASYFSESKAPLDVLEAAHASIARIVVHALMPVG